MQRHDYYSVLGVESTASHKEIEAAYEGLARKYQPDTGQEPLDLERMRGLNQAFDVLDDPGKRAEYDHARANVIQESAQAGATNAQPSEPVLREPVLEGPPPETKKCPFCRRNQV